MRTIRIGSSSSSTFGHLPSLSLRLVSCHFLSLCVVGGALSGLHPRAFTFVRNTLHHATATPTGTTGNGGLNNGLVVEKPKLVLIGGCSGTGKSTFGMSVALDQGILKCISTDILRSVMRSFVTKDISPALHRSSYESSTDDGSDDPIKSWKQTCTVLQHSIDALVDEMINKGGSVVIEGVHIIPNNTLIEKWEANGGIATGIVLSVPDEEAHKSLFRRRGIMTGKGEQDKLEHFDRIRSIHDEMVRLAHGVNWQVIERTFQPDPLEIVSNRLGMSNSVSGGGCGGVAEQEIR